MSPCRRSQLRWRVTPGLAAELATRRPANLFTNALLPMFGKPMTTARTARGCKPRRVLAALMVLPTSAAALITCTDASSSPSQRYPPCLH